MPRLGLTQERVETFKRRGYVCVFFPRNFRPLLLKAVAELGFANIGELLRVATREYLEKRGFLLTSGMGGALMPPNAQADEGEGLGGGRAL